MFGCSQLLKRIAHGNQVQTSCGYGVPYLALKPDPEDASKQLPYLEDRHTLGHWADKLVAADTIHDYRAKSNSYSLDGLPGLRDARQRAGERIWYGDMKVLLRKRSDHIRIGFVALISAFLTILSMYMLGLTTLQSPSVLK